MKKSMFISDVYHQLRNKEKHQQQLDVHYGILNPMIKYYGDTKMANLKENANMYVPETTKNITELDRVDVSTEMHTKIVHEGEQDEFSYDFIEVNDEEYRVPKSVIQQLKSQIEANPSLEFFKVTKSGEGMNTKYTVIPLL